MSSAATAASGASAPPPRSRGTPNSDALESFTKALAYNLTISTFLTGFCFSGIAQFKKDNTIHVDLLSSFRGNAFVAATVLMSSVIWNSGFLTAAHMIIASSKRRQTDLTPRIFIFAWVATAVGLFLVIVSLLCFFETLKAAVKIQTDALGVQIESMHLIWPLATVALLVTSTVGALVYFFGDLTLWTRQESEEERAGGRVKAQ